MTKSAADHATNDNKDIREHTLSITSSNGQDDAKAQISIGQVLEVQGNAEFISAATTAPLDPVRSLRQRCMFCDSLANPFRTLLVVANITSTLPHPSYGMS